MRRIYYSPIATVTSFWAWVYSSWTLNAVSRGYERLGQYREVGTRLFGIEFVWFDSVASQKKYEANR